MLEVILGPTERKAWHALFHNPNILMGALYHLQNATQRHLSPRPNQKEPRLELRDLTSEGLEQHRPLTERHPSMPTIFIQTSLNGKEGEEQFSSSWKT